MRFPRWIFAAVMLMAAATARPSTRTIYPDPAQAHADIAAALKTAAATHKHVLLDFGGNWCGDCIVLDMYFHNQQNRPLLDANYVVVHINVGHLDENLDIARRYQVPVEHGVPEVAVLSETGKLLYSSRTKELELAVQRSDESAVTRFLIQWKPSKQGCSMMATNC
ncbi:thioredoxin family protein [Occallatibacter riparius]|uniref:Thioredoxin family protein n=1 Tax=Occallatibacter riparius TaxID=1002689 RepID=A0A9J7BP26_9BACT|nr:thioredoxin family protein [Occallatibacter riparius]UWZ84281.1 thioredoxin family protein [Occallatibacter riparius]